MVKLIGLSGSLRRASSNSALLRAAADDAGGCRTDHWTYPGYPPLYDGDMEAENGIPGPLATLKETIAAADGLLLVPPEYNNVGDPARAVNTCR